jgi:pyridoxal phosphate enzyme (YggS family)
MTVTMISENIKRIKEKITNAALKAKRSPEDIKLVAVSKRFPADKIIDAITAGQKIFGENYIQEVQEKRNLVPPQTNFHFIGHLQSNKAKIAAETCSMIETVDRLKLGNVLNKHLQSLDKTMDVLIQVNIGNDQNKAGLERSKTEELLIQLNEMSNLRVCGLMTMPPLTDNPELTRPHFRKLRLLAEELVAKDLFQAVEKPELSMGMSEDFHIAIEEGATIVRVGTAIFGQRLYTNK